MECLNFATFTHLHQLLSHVRYVIDRPVPKIIIIFLIVKQDIERFTILDQDIYVFSKDKRAKHIVKEKASLIKKLRPLDAGGTLSARHIEHMVAFLIGLNIRYKTHDCGFTVSGLPVEEW